MALDDTKKQIVLDALVTISEARMRTADAVNELVKQTIRMRDIELQLEMSYERLSGLVRTSETPAIPPSST